MLIYHDRDYETYFFCLPEVFLIVFFFLISTLCDKYLILCDNR